MNAAEADGYQVVTVAVLGPQGRPGLHGPRARLWRLRRFQTGSAAAGLVAVSSYVSLTEVSEYAAGVPEELRQARLYPQLPPEGKPAFCFYPMSQAPGRGAQLVRARLRGAQGAHDRATARSGRTFHGRILQLITGSTGLDDWEWGVTLFGVHPDDLKDCVYTMRFDEASARYAEFGPFYTGMVGDARRGAGGSVERRERDAVTHRLDDAAATSCAGLGRVVVAFSGGADSAFLARVAHDTLGPDAVLCATAVSPSLAAAEEADCRALAAEWGLRWVGVPTDEMEDPRYVANGPDRCAHCKTALMDALGPLAAAEGATVVLGVNLDDLGDHRPGQAAAAAAGAALPAGRGRLHQGRRPATGRGASACGPGTSRPPPAWPPGSPTARRSPSAALRRSSAAEAALHALGLRAAPGPPPRRRGPDRGRGRRAGRGGGPARRGGRGGARRPATRFVTLDLEGFRSGSLNRGLLDDRSGRCPVSERRPR